MAKIFIRLLTACGCSKVFENPLATRPGLEWHVPLMPKPSFSEHQPDPGVFPRNRRFRMRDHQSIGENEVLLTYEEVLE